MIGSVAASERKAPAPGTKKNWEDIQ